MGGRWWSMGEAKEAGGGDHVERIAILSRQHRGG